MHYQNLEKLKRLKLFGMARALEDLQRLADRGQPAARQKIANNLVGLDRALLLEIPRHG